MKVKLFSGIAGIAGSTLLSLSTLTAQTQLHVSPAGTGSAFSPSAPGSLADAMAKVRTLNRAMTADVVVNLRGGRYPLLQGLEFGAEDGGSGGFSVIYRAYAGEKATLSGGRAVTGWSADAGGGLSAPAGGLRFRQLYVNGMRAVRARHPNRDNDLDMGPYFWLRSWDVPGRRIRIDPASTGNWSNLSKVEMVVKSHWATARLPVGSIMTEGKDAILVPAQPGRDQFFHTPYFPVEPDQTYYFENAREFLDASGEWYLDEAADRVHYRPRAGETATALSAYVPVSEQVLHFRGARDIRIEGLILEHSNWLGGDAVNGAAIIDPQGAWRFPAAIHIENSSSIRLEGNIIRHTAAQGVMFSGLTRGNLLDGNTLYDIGANPILFKQAGSKDDRVANNTILLGGREHSSALGILAQLTDQLVVEHNEISHMPYGGIALGWNWFEEVTEARANLVRANHIHHVMQLHDDASGVYTLGRMDGTFIERNYIHDVQRSRWAERFSCSGIYLDQGSMNITVRDNVLEGLEEPTHENPNVPGAVNNAWSNNAGRDPAIMAAAGPPKGLRKVPRAAFQVSASMGKVPFTVNADASAAADDIGIAGYQWDFGDGATATGRLATHVYQRPGTYVLVLRVIDRDTLYDYASAVIQANVGAGSVNLALNAPARSSSDFSSGSRAALGNDGNPNTIWASGTEDTGVHWQVDLGRPERVFQVEMVARQDGDQVPSRQNFEIRGSNDPTFASYNLLAAQGPTIFPAKGTWFASVSDSGRYRHIRVVKPQNVHFHFAELRVFGPPATTVAVGAKPGAGSSRLLRARVRAQRFEVESKDPDRRRPGRWDGSGRRISAF